uniref:Ig-like domain-containing protein n=1 Tax=Scleropages formosus TaxID=113540 RepID=A0A8C9QXA8_SCLFO
MIRLCVTLLTVLSVQLGDSVTLDCIFSKNEIEYISWYKQSIGKRPYLIAISNKYAAEPVFYNNFNSTRFRIQMGERNNELVILKTELSDTATYYCGTRRDYGTLFGGGTFLTVKGKTVVQQPVSDPVHPGDSVTLQCTVDSETCAGEHSVYWFRHGSGESLPGLIYTHGNRSDECEKSPEAGSPTHSCVYSLPKRNLRRSDAGIYYCVVVTCGDILFGNGTQLEIEGSSMAAVVFGLAVLLCLCVIVNIVLITTRNKKCCKHFKNFLKKPVFFSQNQDAEMLNYAALHFSDKKPKNARRKKELKEEIVYSHVTYTARD